MHPSTPPASADRNLLFGILALQMDFVSRDQLVAAMHAWVLDKAKALGQILVEQGALSQARCSLLDTLVDEHLRQHGQDPERSLAALTMSSPLRRELRELADGDVDASVALVPEAGPPTVSYNPPGDGQARYQVLRPHAKGGLGEVFVALDGELQHEVALKEIAARHADNPDSRGRFVKEAEITGKLEHPGVVPVYGLGQHADGRPFYAMRFVRGETLKEAIGRLHATAASGGRQPPGAVQHQGADAPHSPDLGLRGLLGRFVAVCNTIAYAHSRGILHRDLKPSNILLGPYGETLVVDWGLAKAVGSGHRAAGSQAKQEPTLLPQLSQGAVETLAGSALGTPAYMSPEQAAGRLEQLGPASDVYSLGATLYSLLTGRPPIEGKDTAEVLRKAQNGEVVPPRRVKPHVPAALEAVCLKALARWPTARYPSALALAADVERWLADEPVSAWPEPWTVRAGRWGRRHRALVMAALAAVAVTLVGLTVGLFLLRAAAETEAKARKVAEDKGEETRRVLYAAHMNLVQREYEADNLTHVRELLAKHAMGPLGLKKDLRGFEWYYWNGRLHRELRTIMTHAGAVRRMTFSPDGRLLAGVVGDGTVRLWDAASGGAYFALKGHTGAVRSVAFSPDGRRLAGAGTGAMVHLWDAATGQEVLTCKGHTGAVNSVAFNPDGRRLAGAGDDGTVRLWDAASGRELGTLKRHTGAVRSVAFSADGRRLASAGGDGTVRLWDAASGQEVLTLQDVGGIQSVAFSPDSRHLASASNDGTVRLWDAVSGQTVLTLKKQVGAGGTMIPRPTFSPDGHRLASAGEDGTVRLWDAASGQEVLTLKARTGMVSGAAFSPDGRRLAGAGRGGTVWLWDAASGRELLALKGHTGEVVAVAFSPDGRRLASAGWDDTMRLWDAASDQEVLTLKGHTAAVTCVAFSPDGRRLASGGWDSTARVWDAASGQEVLTLKRHTGAVHGVTFNRLGCPLPKAAVTTVAFSPDGHRLASAGADNNVRLWNAASGGELLVLKGHTAAVTCVAFSPDGHRLASAGGDRTVQLWDAVSGREVLTLKGHTGWVTSVAFSPDGRRLASAGWDKTVRLWDAASGREVRTLERHTGEVVAVAFSPDGRRLASAGEDGPVRLWDAVSGQELLTLKGHTGWVTSVAFSPDGRRLASAGWDKTVRLWDAATGQDVLTLKGHTAAVNSVAFSPDGNSLASASKDGTLKVWETAVSAEDLRRREVVSMVQERFDRLLLRSEVLASLRQDQTLDPATRAFGLQVAQTTSKNPVRLNDAAWAAVKVRSRGRQAYAVALRRARAAVQAEPNAGNYLMTLGVARYRVGDHAQALEALQKSEKLNTKKEGPEPTDLAFLAMSHHQLGHKEEAQTYFRRLHEVMKQPTWADNAEAQSFLREAEELLQGQGKHPAEQGRR
jgi:WD40 repeat protein/serine/threonine protein kinase